MTVIAARARHLRALGAVVLGAGWLAARPALLTAGATTSTLALGYALTGVVALRAPVPGSERGLVSRSTGLFLGAGAVAAAATLGGLPGRAPMRSSALLLGLLAALAEEIVFRRALYGWLSRHGAVIAILGSAALFALVHLPAYGAAALPVDLGAGLLLSWQRWATGSWGVPALTHMSANALVVILR